MKEIFLENPRAQRATRSHEGLEQGSKISKYQQKAK